MGDSLVGQRFVQAYQKLMKKHRFYKIKMNEILEKKTSADMSISFEGLELSDEDSDE